MSRYEWEWMWETLVKFHKVKYWEELWHGLTLVWRPWGQWRSPGWAYMSGVQCRQHKNDSFHSNTQSSMYIETFPTHFSKLHTSFPLSRLSICWWNLYKSWIFLQSCNMFKGEIQHLTIICIRFAKLTINSMAKTAKYVLYKFVVLINWAKLGIYIFFVTVTKNTLKLIRRQKIINKVQNWYGM